MKRIILLVIIVLLFSTVSSVEARHRRRSPRPTPKPSVTLTPTPTVKITLTPTMSPTLTPTPTTTPSTKGNLCINYGHQTNKYDLIGQSNTDLNKIKSSGINCIRLAYEAWNYKPSGDLAILAKSKGFRVIIGGHFGTLSSSGLNSYRSQVLQEALWAESNHIDQLSLGNEQEDKLSGLSNDQWYNFLISLASDVRKIYSGKISYESSGSDFDFWLNKPLGNIDLLGFNMYSGYSTNADRLLRYITIHGKDHVYLSESNMDMDTGKYSNDTFHASEVSKNTIKLLDLGIPVYYFTYSTCNNGVPNHWGLYTCGVLKQPETAKILGL